MDIRDIKIKVIELRKALRSNKIHGDIFILYGSYAAGKNRPDSDIDIAVISRDFGKNRFKEGSLLNYLTYKIDPLIEAVPFSLNEYMNKESISPLLHEIEKKGVILL
ncbi:MAG TPA: nucleotidyltransferase domain-containing protein [Spirochaetota bacterium]|nr:nucleotidyltransferase domain-containing protein [Spirochaetota bacterium]HRX49717.1 nucleotidyltransferase domain-containing protein [Spirochaetota bacterium]